MLHDVEFYTMVMAQPGAPREVGAERDGDRLTLSWQPARYAKEVAGYVVYRSDPPGGAGELTTREPVAGTGFETRVPADGRFVVWGLLESLDGKIGARVRLALDGDDLGAQNLDLQYICVGHGGPTLETELWDCLRPTQGTPDAAMAYQASAGEHELALRAIGDTTVRFKRFVITNDLGWEPEGRTGFLIK